MGTARPEGGGPRLAAWHPTRQAASTQPREVRITTHCPEHALDAPFTLPAVWAPISGTCSRCGARAWLGERRWWHEGPTCRARPTDRITAPVTAEFIADPHEGAHR